MLLSELISKGFGVDSLVQTLHLKLLVTAVPLLHFPQQRLAGSDPEAIPSLMVLKAELRTDRGLIRIVLMGGAIKDAFGGLLHTVQIPTGDVAGVA